MQQSTSKQKPAYMGVDDAEVMSGLSKWTWRKYAYEGRIASTKVGRRLLIPVAEIERIMSEGLRPAVARQ
jgi:hypothetical protein